MLKLIGIFSVVWFSELNLCQEYLNMAMCKILLIISSTFRYVWNASPAGVNELYSVHL